MKENKANKRMDWSRKYDLRLPINKLGLEKIFFER